jgi:hypothetical protein
VPVLVPGGLLSQEKNGPRNTASSSCIRNASMELTGPGGNVHEYLTMLCRLDAGYSTSIRWFHDEGFRLKVPRPRPHGEDVEKRKAFVEGSRKW